MFDLIQDKVERPYRHSTRGATIAAAIGHVVVITLLLVIPLLYATDVIPDVPTMMAFVAPSAAPPPPPPPPPPAAPPTAAPRQATAPVASSVNPAAAPVEAPAEIKPEPPGPPPSNIGQVGGVVGGIEGGVAGGIIGGLVTAVAPPPPPPPPPAQVERQPVRIGGQVVAPALIRRVDPEYPAIAVAAKVEGLVILEAVIDTDGKVQEVHILRSVRLLDKAAIEAVQQWRYAPLMLNGVPTRFVLSVTLNFALKHDVHEVG